MMLVTALAPHAPLDGILLGDLVLHADLVRRAAAAGNTVAWPLQVHVEVHACARRAHF